MRGSWRPNRTATYWPPLLWPQQRFFPVLLGCSTGKPGSLGSLGAGFLYRILSPTRLIPNSQSGAWGLPLLGTVFLYRILSPTDWISYALSYIIVQHPPSSCGRHNFALIQHVHGNLIFLDRMHLVFTQVHFLSWQLGRVAGQYTTLCGDRNEKIYHIIWECSTLVQKEYCEVAKNIYPKTGVYFSHVWNRGSLALDPSQNKFQLRFLLRTPGELADNVEVNLGLDCRPLARVFQISRSHTTSSSYPKGNGRYGPLGLDIIL